LIENKTFKELDIEIEEFVRLGFASKDLISLTNQVAMNPTLLKGEELNLFSSVKKDGLRLTDKVFLAVLSWYLPKEIGSLLNLRLEEVWGQERLDLKALLLDSKFTCLGTLLVCDLWNGFDFYGNYLSEKSNIFKKLCRKYFSILSFKRLRRKARPLVRRRGHRDGGRKEKCRPFDKNRKAERPVVPISEFLEEQSILFFKIESLRQEIERRWDLENQVV